MATSAKHRLEYGAFKALFLSTRLMSRPFLLWWGRQLGSFVWKVVGFRRGVILENLRQAYPDRKPEWHRRTAHEFYRNLGMTLMEFLASGHRSRDDLIRNVSLLGGENLLAMQESGRGAIFLSGHFGNFELMLPRAATHGLRCHGVVKPQSNRLIDRFHNDLRAREGVSIVPTGGSFPRLLEILARGEFVGLLGDQDAGRKGQFVEFLGRPASVNRGPATLAVKSGCPLVLAFLFRQPDHSHVLEVLPPLHPDPDLDTEAAITRLTEQHTALLAEAVHRQPSMYYWIHRRWKTRPKTGAETGKTGSQNS